MYIGLKNIQQLLSSYPNHLTHSDSVHCLTGWGKLANTPTPYTPHLLYVCEYSEDIKKCPLNADMHLLCIAKEGTDLTQLAGEFPEDYSILFVAAENPEPIFTELQRYFNIQCGVGMFGQTLLEFLAFDDGLQAAIDHSLNVFHNPVFVFDANFNLIAATWDEINRLHIEDDVIKNKRFSDSDFKMANRADHLHERVRNSEVPIRAYNEALGYEQLLCAIDTKKDMGHIVVSAVNQPFEPIDTEFLLILKKYVGQQMKKDSFIQNARGFNYEYFLKDLLDRKVATGTPQSAHMDYVKKEFGGNMHCMVIETARSAGTLNVYHIRNMIEGRFPNSKTLIYNGQIITILSVPSNAYLPQEYLDIAERLCKDEELYAGMSICFTDIIDFSEYYQQALRAIELGVSRQNEPGLFYYKDYFLDHMKNIFLQKESAKTFCHPKMKILLDYDKKHHSELAYTFYMYLIHERNIAAASSAMHMHRTSLVYRFKKINSLIGENFEDHLERMHLILSYELMGKQ